MKINFAAILFFVMTINCFAQTNQPALETNRVSFSVAKLMSHDDFTKAGLGKLDTEEIKALNDWLQDYTQSITKTNLTILTVTNIEPAIVKRVLVVPQQIEEGVIETYIDGDFEGWEGETIWKMDNGQIWQQASYAYHYHYAYHPKVLIYRADVGWKMKADDDDESVAVKRIK